MSNYNTRQKMDGSGQFGFACRRITRGKSAGKFTVEYGLAERNGPACLTRRIRGTVDEAEARRFCRESLIAFPEPPAPKPLPYTFTALLERLVVDEWFLPYAPGGWVRRPVYICQQLHRRGVLEKRWRGGTPPTIEQLRDRSLDVNDFHEYRLTVAAVLALGSVEVYYGTKTGWARATENPQHFYRNGSRLCGPEGSPAREGYQGAPAAHACPVCQQLLPTASR